MKGHRRSKWQRCTMPESKSAASFLPSPSFAHVKSFLQFHSVLCTVIPQYGKVYNTVQTSPWPLPTWSARTARPRHGVLAFKCASRACAVTVCRDIRVKEDENVVRDWNLLSFVLYQWLICLTMLSCNHAIKDTIEEELGRVCWKETRAVCQWQTYAMMGS